MSFLFINKTLRLNNLKTRTTVNAKISVFVICLEAIIYLLLFNLHNCTFNAIRKYYVHSSIIKISIIKIKSSLRSARIFDFNFVVSDEISKIITSLELIKRVLVLLFQQKILNSKQRNFWRFSKLTAIRECIKRNEFSNELKAADITHKLKRGSIKQSIDL